MSRLRGLWFESRHLDAGDSQVLPDLAALGAEEREEVLATGDRVAAVSLTLAQQYCRRAAAGWRLGPVEFHRWVDRGLRLAAAETGSRAAAASYFALAPAALAALPATDVDTWIDLSCRVLEASRRLGEVFVAESGPILGDLDRRAQRLERWVTEGLALVRADSWEAELVGLHFFAATALALPLFACEDFHAWAEIGRAAERRGPRSELFTSVPPAMHVLPEDDRGAVLRLARAAADRAPAVAVELYFSLPTVLEALPDDRPALLASLAPVAAHAPASLPELLPVLRAILESTPPALRRAALGLAGEVAAAFPEGLVPFYRVLPRLIERTGVEGLARWVHTGLDTAEENPTAGRAYFSLDSRTSRAVLVTESTAVELAEVESLLRRYLHMLSGRTWRVAGDPAVTYRPPFATTHARGHAAAPPTIGTDASLGSSSDSALAPAAGEPGDDTPEALFPLRVDVFPTAEANLRLYRLIAAQHAGRSEFGSDAIEPSLAGFLTSFEQPEVAAELLAIFEGVRVDAAVARAYRGLAADLRAVAADRARGTVRLPGTIEHFVDVLRQARRPEIARRLPAIAERLAAETATAADSAAATRAVYAEIMRGDYVQVLSADPAGFADLLAESEVLDARLELDAGSDALGQGERTDDAGASGAEAIDERMDPLTLSPERDDAGPGTPIDPETLLQMLRQGADLTVKQGGGAEHVEALGLYISDLAGKLPRERMQELQAALREAHAGHRTTRPAAGGDGEFVYDEWDHQIADYRHAWCRLAEIPLASDTGDFFQHTLAIHADLLPEVRRQFQRIRPERYRVVHGLEDGEDFDLNAVIDARADRRAGHAPSPKVYQARQREERDVATLFLIDMSASTDEPVPDAPGRRVIDITKEALVVMSEALEEIGDAYGVYGFSGHGRQQVEFYLVKQFNEALSAAVKGRVGAIEPKRSTRMGAALRHAVAKLRRVGARSKHVILLSDGFPQDLDYGDDRRSNTYGIQDTMMAFQEAMRAGVMPFCITVDKAGHDYLKEICDASRYLVIEDITALPRELPKIYQRFVRP
jgi:nitric oxide reductase NorD protein